MDSMLEPYTDHFPEPVAKIATWCEEPGRFLPGDIMRTKWQSIGDNFVADLPSVGARELERFI